MYHKPESVNLPTGECGCVAGYSESCKHVLALLHFIEHQVSLGLNKTCISKRQIWHATVTKKGEKIHPPDKIRKILFDRLENEEGYKRPKRFLLDPRPVHDRETTIDWNQLSVASEGNTSVLCLKKINDSFVDHNYQPSLVMQDLQPLTVRNIASEAQNINTLKE